MRVLICGDRDWGQDGDLAAAYRTMSGRMRPLPKDTVVIEGGAKGADTMGKTVAQELGLLVVEYPANWDFQRRAAGPIRNSAMLKDGRPDLVLAFHADIEASRGTADMVAKARKAGVMVEVITGTEEEVR